MNRFYFKHNEIQILKTVCNMLDHNSQNENKVNITAFTIAKETGLDYHTVRNKLKKIKDL